MYKKNVFLTGFLRWIIKFRENRKCGTRALSPIIKKTKKNNLSLINFHTNRQIFWLLIIEQQKSNPNWIYGSFPRCCCCCCCKPSSVDTQFPMMLCSDAVQGGWWEIMWQAGGGVAWNGQTAPPPPPGGWWEMGVRRCERGVGGALRGRGGAKLE